MPDVRFWALGRVALESPYTCILWTRNSYYNGRKEKRFIKGESFPTSVYILCLKDKIRRMHYQLLHGAEGGWVWDLFE